MEFILQDSSNPKNQIKVVTLDGRIRVISNPNHIPFKYHPGDEFTGAHADSIEGFTVQHTTADKDAVVAEIRRMIKNILSEDAPKKDDKKKNCPKCKGTGKMNLGRGSGGRYGATTICDNCIGTGKVKKSLKEQTRYEPYDSTVSSRMFANKLKGGKALKNPSKSEFDHELMRLKTMLLGGHFNQYSLRVTKITNPQKMYSAFLLIKALSKKNSTFGSMAKGLLENIKKYLKTNGYEEYVKTKLQGYDEELSGIKIH